MTPATKKIPHDPQLRLAAETRLENAAEANETQPSELLHELQVHQIELEMQNATLRETQIALEKSRNHYAELYEFAPVGYATMTADGVITKINLAGAALLGGDSSQHIGLNFASFIAHEDSDRWYLHFKHQRQSTNVRQSIELTLMPRSGCAACVQLDFQIRHADDTDIGITIIDLSERKRAEALIWDQAHYDTLTKLPNRHMFHNRLRLSIDRARQIGTSVALLLIDLDGFKEINDTLGHNKGDILLIEVARRIAGCVRESATLARLGGDEFTVILNQTDELANAKLIAKNIIAQLAAPYRLLDETVYVSASIGISLFPNDGSDIEDILKHADQAMYAAKNAGRNRFFFFTRELQTAALSRMSLTNDLRIALAENQFEVYYQPIIELATGEIRKAEALIRWHHPTRGMVSPVEFIPLAESSGLILDIGEWVFKTAAEQVRHLRAMGHARFQISVNVSPVQFLGDSDLSNMWLNNLGALGLPTQSMVIEITEGLMMDISADVKEKLIAFGGAGSQVALDDFGTGYSSLSYLKKFDIDYLKIDRSFVSNLETDSDNHALCEAIIVMAHKLGLRVIAEGVETAAQRNLLLAAGCDFAQGFLYSKPVPTALFEQLLPPPDAF